MRLYRQTPRVLSSTDFVFLRSFCLKASLGDPDYALGNASAAHLKAFFQWVIENAERTAQQGITLKQYFRLLKMIYKQITGTLLDESMVSDVNAVSVVGETFHDVELIF